MIKIAENKIRPARVTKEPAEACSFRFAGLDARAVCELTDEVEIELLAILHLLEHLLN